MKAIIFRVNNVTRDRRNRGQLELARKLNQDRLDQAIEREFNERVRLNVQRRLNRRVEEILNTPAVAQPIPEIVAGDEELNVGNWL